MQTALILMAILGCDDTATQCHYVEMRDERWATIQMCDAASEDKLKLYPNLEYPVVVAVCQTPGDTGLPELAGEVPGETGTETGDQIAAVPVDDSDNMVPKAEIPSPVATPAQVDTANPDEDAGFAARVLKRFKDALPEAETLKTIAAEPVHVVTDSYSWVARRFEK